MLRKDDFAMCLDELNYEISHLEGILNSISIGKVMEKMGFPINFMEIERID